jgi:hypothetical protein
MGQEQYQGGRGWWENVAMKHAGLGWLTGAFCWARWCCTINVKAAGAAGVDTTLNTRSCPMGCDLAQAQ